MNTTIPQYVRLFAMLFFFTALEIFLSNPTSLLAAEPTEDCKQCAKQDIEKYFAERKPELKNASQVFSDDIQRRTLYQSLYNADLKMLAGADSYSRIFDEKVDFDRGDLKKLSWVIETNKTVYRSGEPIGIRVSLKNTSDDDAVVRFPRGFCFGFCIGSLKIQKVQKSEKQEVSLTREGYRRITSLTHEKHLTFVKSQMKPGDTILTRQPMKTLNLYYDLSQEGKYELTFRTWNCFLDDEDQVDEVPKPCTVHFKIEGGENSFDNKVVW